MEIISKRIPSAITSNNTKIAIGIGSIFTVSVAINEKTIDSINDKSDTVATHLPVELLSFSSFESFDFIFILSPLKSNNKMVIS